MTIKVSGSTLTFSDSTTMTTAAAAGPPGPTGPTGPSGPPGPSGSTAFALLTSSTSSSGVASFDFPSVITGSYTKYRVIAEGIYSLGGSVFYPPYLRFYSAGSFDTNTVYGYNTLWSSGNPSGNAQILGGGNSDRLYLGPPGGALVGNYPKNAYFIVIDITTYYNNSSGNYTSQLTFVGSGGSGNNYGYTWSGSGEYVAAMSTTAIATGLQIVGQSVYDLVGKVSVYGVS